MHNNTKNAVPKIPFIRTKPYGQVHSGEHNHQKVHGVLLKRLHESTNFYQLWCIMLRISTPTGPSVFQETETTFIGYTVSKVH